MVLTPWNREFGGHFSLRAFSKEKMEKIRIDCIWLIFYLSVYIYIESWLYAYNCFGVRRHMQIASFAFFWISWGFLQHSLQLSELPEKTGKETPLRLGYVGMLLKVWQYIPTLAIQKCQQLWLLKFQLRLSPARNVLLEGPSTESIQPENFGSRPNRWRYFWNHLEGFSGEADQLMPIVFEFVTEICQDIKDN